MAGIGLGVVCGRLGDIYDHHKMYGFGMAVLALGSLLCALSQDVFQLILFRFRARHRRRDGSVFPTHVGVQGYAGRLRGKGARTDGHVAPVRLFVGPPLGG